jgi:hypothetical protein
MRSFFSSNYVDFTLERIAMIFPLLPHLAPAYYLDPGSGSMIIQLILGSLLAIGIAVRVFWGKIKGRFGGAKPDDSATDDSSDSD